LWERALQLNIENLRGEGAAIGDWQKLFFKTKTPEWAWEKKLIVIKICDNVW